MSAVFAISAEPLEGKTYVLPDGVDDEHQAREAAMAHFNAHAELRTVALMRKRKVFDVYDGRWSSEMDWDEEPTDDRT